MKIGFVSGKVRSYDTNDIEDIRFQDNFLTGKHIISLNCCANETVVIDVEEGEKLISNYFNLIKVIKYVFVRLQFKHGTITLKRVFKL